MKYVVIGVHRAAEDIVNVAEAIPAGEVVLSVLSLEDDAPVGDRGLLLRLAEIRAALLARATFIAVRYGFIARSQADAQERCAPFIARWKTTLDAHSSHVEMTMKLVASGAPRRPQRKDFSSGAEYMRALHNRVQAARIDPQFEREVTDVILRHAVAHRWLDRDGTSRELAFLIDRADIDRVRLAGETLKSRNPDVPFLLSGPWPLEVFADADHE